MLTDLVYEHTADLRREAAAARPGLAVAAEMRAARPTGNAHRAASRAGRAAPSGARRVARGMTRALGTALHRPASARGCEA